MKHIGVSYSLSLSLRLKQLSDVHSKKILSTDAAVTNASTTLEKDVLHIFHAQP